MINPLLSRKEKVKTILNDEVGSFFREGGDNVQFIQLVPKVFYLHWYSHSFAQLLWGSLLNLLVS